MGGPSDALYRQRLNQGSVFTLGVKSDWVQVIRNGTALDRIHNASILSCHR